MHELQHSTLFIPRLDFRAAGRRGVALSDQLAYAVHRVAEVEGGQYVQLLCSGASVRANVGAGAAVGDDLPASLVFGQDPFFRESDGPDCGAAEGFFWLSIEDFRALFSVMIECRLVVTAEEWASWNLLGATAAATANVKAGGGAWSQQQPQLSHELKVMAPTSRPLVPYPVRVPPPPLQYHETMLAFAGKVEEESELLPSFLIRCPEGRHPTEVLVSLQQADKRHLHPDSRLASEGGPEMAAALLRVFEKVDVGMFALVARQGSWTRARDSTVSFKIVGGGVGSAGVSASVFVLKMSLPPGSAQVASRLILRVYSHPHPIHVSTLPPGEPFTIVQPDTPLTAIPFSLSCAGQEVCRPGEEDPLEGEGTRWAVHRAAEKRRRDVTAGSGAADAAGCRLM